MAALAQVALLITILSTVYANPAVLVALSKMLQLEHAQLATLIVLPVLGLQPTVAPVWQAPYSTTTLAYQAALTITFLLMVTASLVVAASLVQALRLVSSAIQAITYLEALATLNALIQA